ncbi:MAG TPA: dihydrofolate reductase [Micavibrio sp.]|nr:dihydrofolate reductase [Micavibrio sp.]
MKKVISLVVAAADNNVIGRDNVMPWHIPEDFKHFKTVTMGKPCIMGRKTFESILEQLGKPLPGRVNIIVSRKNYQHGGALTCKDLEEAIDQASKTETDEICIVGGAQIYAQALNLADKIYLTRVHQSPRGDAFFPALGAEWVEESRDEREGFSFLTYTRAEQRPAPV